jgi:hypothetical protein
MRPSFVLGRSRARGAALLFVASATAAAFAVPACSSDVTAPRHDTPAGHTLAPGEVCDAPSPAQVRVRFAPSAIVVPTCEAGAACVSRSAKVVVDPDFCSRYPVSFETSAADVVPAVPAGAVDLHEPSVPVTITGGAKAGAATITVRVPRGDGTDATAELAVEVLDPALPACAGGPETGTVKAGSGVSGSGGLAGASISLPEGADKPNEGSFLWSVPAFEGSIACGDDVVPPGYVALGPAIELGPVDATFPREIPLSIPVNPARLPAAAHLRHLRVSFSSPSFKAPRTVPVADMRLDKVGGQWALTFKAPRLGTYQAVVAEDAGTKTRKRRLTHRAVVGVSMGGSGTAMFGLRNHALFDTFAPLGGPVDWTYLIDHLKNNHLAGFRAIEPGTTLDQIPLERAACATSADCDEDESCVGLKCTLMPKATAPYEHPSTFNTWWYEYPRTGNGGGFPRGEYAQIFRDLSLMFGNPNGDNLTKGAEHLPPGVRPDDPSVLGDHPGDECAVWVDPLDGPDKEHQQEISNNCPGERCSHPLTLTGYYDDEYNPDGTFPVITVCDGSPQDSALTPYANTWKPGTNNYPLEVALAVDYNGNGVRDELEPVIRQGHEPWRDVGTDGLASVDEPGFDAATNPDPAGDDYDPQYNPTGTEGNKRWEEGEPFDDVGLDGVANTPQQPAYPVGWQAPGDGYDVGEGDGKFTVARGLQTIWDRDARSVVRRTAAGVPSGELDDDALARIDLWTDGGTRDLFNFAVAAQNLVGAFATRGRDVTYLTEFNYAQGLDPKKPDEFFPSRILYDEMPGIVFQRYGKMDPEPADLENGSGQHVGTANEIASRLQDALYFVGSRWKEPDLRKRVYDTQDKPAEGIDPCQIIGNCTIEFTSSFGRKGPVGITLPPGYGHADQQDRRYPVIYMLHGYGQTPEDLEAAIVFLKNWMNSPADGMNSRLPKAILVYVDGRCRVDQNDKAECIRGSFYTDSVREDGVLSEKWWLELIDYIDQNYRTMGPSEVDWTE